MCCVLLRVGKTYVFFAFADSMLAQYFENYSKKLTFFYLGKLGKIGYYLLLLFSLRHEAQTTGVELKRFDGIRVGGTFKKLIM